MPDLPGFFFRPNHNLQDLFPPLLGVGFALVLVVLIWMVSLFIQKHQQRSLSLRKFYGLAGRYHLNRVETAFLQKLAKTSNISSPSLLLTNEEFFEKIVRVLENHGRRSEKRLIQRIREKLFYRAAPPPGTRKTTASIPVGSMLHIRYLNRPETLIWGRLVDNDKEGLIVIVPSHRGKIPSLRINAHLEVAAILSDQEELHFVTWIRSVIPGPRNMIILGHSDFVEFYNKREGMVRWIVPSFHGGARDSKAPA
ncbi:MAG: hypothetical protein ACP5I1_04210 [Candidatus Hinthialibacter sp.]